ncbi:MAG TPA: sodium:solute symporter family protein [Candidatus Baltobacteraceae bacterium]|jgi:SSS family solute:Na+ symporter|nr:sodium:solute symporter family protein [Candidatus Baltobacteraceae bacterium]
MTASPLALSIVAVVVLGTIGFALLSVRHIKMDPQQYMVGGRSFGTIFLWVLLAGEIYTTFTFLGIAGLSYSQGAPAYYVMAYGVCAYVIGYFLTPAIWRVAKAANLLTGADFFETRYNSRALGVAVALLWFVMIVPYVALQLSGLQILLRIAGYGAYNATASVCVAFIVLALFVFTAGLRGTAWASVVKDVFVLAAVIFAGIAIPIRFFGSPSAMLQRVVAAHPHMLVLPIGTAFHGTVWYVTTVLLSAIGFYMGPHTITAVYSARSGEALRRNAMLLPFYQIFLCLMIFAGLSAMLIVPGLTGTAVDQSFLLVVQRYYPSWVLGLITSAGALAALVPASALLLAGAGVITKNVAGDWLGIATGDRERTRLTRILVLVVAALALVFWLDAQRTVVELLLLYYNGITQFTPGVVASFLWKRATAWGVGLGIAVGLLVAVPLAALNITPWGINVGLLGLAANVVVLIGVSLLRKPR